MESDDSVEPPDYNRNIFKIYFYHYAANGYNDILEDYGRFRQPGIPELRIRHSAVLVKIGRNDVRGLRKNEMNLENVDGNLVCWTILNLPFDVNFTLNPGNQLPECTEFWGYCHRCHPTDKSYHFQIRSRNHVCNFTQHVLVSRHVHRNRTYTCDNCNGKVFPGQREYQQHFCVRFRLNHPNPSEYSMETLDSAFGATLEDLKEYQQYRILYETKKSLPGIWPVVNVTRQLRRYPWKDFANPHGISFLKNVLKALQELPPPKNVDFILLDKNIRILKPDGTYIPMPEEVLRPHADHFLIEDSQDGLNFVVRLKDTRENDVDDQPLVQNLELTVFQRFTVKNGYPFQPHR